MGVGQETCYNVPTLQPEQIQVEIVLPEPVQKCQTRTVIVPTVECEDVTDKRCVKLPSVEEVAIEAEACVPVVAKPKCDKVELVLPKQVCRELLYGYAEKPVHQYQHSDHPPVIIKHASKIKYGPKIEKEVVPESEVAPTARALDISKIPDTYTAPE